MSERWNHALCDSCWNLIEPDRTPVKMVGAVDICCRCSRWTDSGIYRREDPDEMPCGGKHIHDALPLTAIDNLRDTHLRIELMGAHIENLIQRVHDLEVGNMP